MLSSTRSISYKLLSLFAVSPCSMFNVYVLQLADPDHLVVTTRNREKYSCKYKASLQDISDDDGEDGQVEVSR